jgi:predicted DNA-binding protein (MmcQ/YjbR family)
MNPEEIRNLCLSFPGTSEEFPFDENVLVYKVHGKIFLLTDVRYFKSLNLKCDPELALELREKHTAVKPGFHMNKKHWNTIEVPGDYSRRDLTEWINHSYHQVIKGLPARLRNQVDKTSEI